MSTLDPSLSAEATDPADWGQINAMPAGGVQAGDGATAPIQNSSTEIGALARIGWPLLLSLPEPASHR